MNQTIETAAGFSAEAVTEISGVLRPLLADVFSLYLKTKSFHWHMTGSHFRDYHLLLDEQAEQIFAMTDEIAERGRKLGGNALRSIGDIARNQRLRDSDQTGLGPLDMIRMLLEDNRELLRLLRAAHALCEEHRD